jgi:hypothetical protein
MKFSPLKLLLGAATPSIITGDADTHSCSTSLGWQVLFLHGILGDDGHPHTGHVGEFVQ